MIYVESCLLCCKSQNHFVDTPYYYIENNRKIFVVKCKNCGFEFLSSQLSDEEEMNVYTDEYFKYYTNSDIIKRQQSFYNEYGKYIEDYIKTSHSLFEIGCASGVMLKFYEDNGIEIVKGIEINNNIAEIGRVNYGLDIESIRIEDFKCDEKFDTVLCIDLLEHIKKPHEVLRKAYELLNDNGYLIIISPLEFNYIGCKIEKILKIKRDKGNIHHYSFFNKNTLAQFCKINDFKIKEYKEFYTRIGSKNLKKYKIRGFIKKYIFDHINGYITNKFNIFGSRFLLIAQKIENRCCD